VNGTGEHGSSSERPSGHAPGWPFQFSGHAQYEAEKAPNRRRCPDHLVHVCSSCILWALSSGRGDPEHPLSARVGPTAPQARLRTTYRRGYGAPDRRGSLLRAAAVQKTALWTRWTQIPGIAARGLWPCCAWNISGKSSPGAFRLRTAGVLRSVSDARFHLLTFKRRELRPYWRHVAAAREKRFRVAMSHDFAPLERRNPHLYWLALGGVLWPQERGESHRGRISDAPELSGFHIRQEQSVGLSLLETPDDMRLR
jgi:hypothetical protein